MYVFGVVPDGDREGREGRESRDNEEEEKRVRERSAVQVHTTGAVVVGIGREAHTVTVDGAC